MSYAVGGKFEGIVRRRRRLRVELTTATFCAALFVISSFAGDVRAGGTPPITLAGMNSPSVRVDQVGELFVNISDGYITSSSGYTLYWFFGGTNSTAFSVRKQVTAGGLGCTIGTLCPVVIADTIYFTYNFTGSYDVSVTVYDQGTPQDYAIGTFVVTVGDSIRIACAQAEAAAGGAEEGVTTEFWARVTPDPNVTYLWNFGDGSQAYGTTEVNTGPPTTNVCAPTRGMVSNTVQHVYESNGTFVVTLTAYDPFGAAARNYLIVTVLNPSIAMSVISSDFPVGSSVNDSVRFWANATDTDPNDIANLTFLWTFGDGSSPTASYSLQSSAYGKGETTVVHAYRHTGSFTVTVKVSDGRIPIGSKSPSHSGTVNVTVPAVTGGSGCSWGPSEAVGSRATLNVGACTSLNNATPFFNVTWTGGNNTGYGVNSPVGSFTYGSRSVTATVKSLSGLSVLSTTKTATYQDENPTVGVVASYVQPQINLTILTSLCPFTSIQVDVYEASKMVSSGQYNGTCGPAPPSAAVSLPIVPFYLGNPYTVTTDYSPNGPTGSTSIHLSFAFAGTGGTTITYSHTFNNSGPTPWSLNANATSVKEPVFLKTNIFSPADTNLNTTWTFGDGSNFTYRSSAPVSIGPTFVTYTAQHRWSAFGIYTISVLTTDPRLGSQGGLSGTQSFKLSQASGDIFVTDAAPSLSISIPSKTYQDEPFNISGIATNSISSLGQSGPIHWGYGDGSTGSGSSTIHLYQYGGSYALVAIAVSAYGSQGVNWTWVNILVQAPAAHVGCPATQVPVDSILTLNAASSATDQAGARALEYGWDFGDGSSAAGVGLAGMNTTHVYTVTGNYSLTLTVSNGGGSYSVQSCAVQIVEPHLYGSIPSTSTAVADLSAPYQVKLGSPGPHPDPYAWANWTWGGGGGGIISNPNGTQGLVETHTYVTLGTYELSVKLTDPNLFPRSSSTIYSNVTVIDAAPFISSPYSGARVYGENHTEALTFNTLGTYADSIAGGSHKWLVNVSWGDGSNISSTSTSAGHLTALSHSYSISGAVALSVTATTPYSGALGGSSSLVDELVLVADWDGDGLPNTFEALVTHTSPSCVATGPPCEGTHGTGFTDFFQALFGGELGNGSSDPDGDGLTNAQEVTGSVTGFPSNPVDSNTAGDGVPDGGHYFTDTFVANQTAVFNWSTQKTATVTIPSVFYGGDPTQFNQTRFTVQLNESSTGWSGTTIYLNSSGGIDLSLAPHNFTSEVYLLNSTPQTGGRSQYGYDLADFESPENWTVTVVSGLAINGSIPSAQIAISYYTNPGVADPTHQGMLEGSTVTTPIFNCSAPSTENFTSFNWTSLKASTISYWPYAEEYYKLSVEQGVPYVPGWNSSVAGQNNASGACSGLSSDAGSTASYLGDADFGISPWNAHAAGDPSLTNGMKALGARNYTLTAWEYVSKTTGSLTSISASGPYPPDPMYSTSPSAGARQLPLNPTALSSAGDGVADSAAADPYAPLALAVDIYHFTDSSTCFWWTPLLIAGVTSVGSGSTPSSTVYTPEVIGTSPGSSCDLGVGDSSYTGNFNDKFTLPVNNSLSTYTVTFSLYQNDSFQTGSDESGVLSGPLTSGSTVWTATGAALNASIEVAPLPQAHVVLVNDTGELSSLPGYGPRYEGEQRYYAFSINQGAAEGPFVAGLNIILESRHSYLNSPAGQWTTNDTESVSSHLACITDASPIVTQLSGSGTVGLAGTWTANLASNSSCAWHLLNETLPLNSTGTVDGAWTALSSRQLSLLGLPGSLGFLAPYVAVFGFDSPTGTAPVGALQASASSVIGGVTIIAQMFLFVESAPYLAMGQIAYEAGEYLWHWGAGAAAAIAAGLQAALSILQSILNFVVSLATALLTALYSPVANAAFSYVSGESSDLSSAAKDLPSRGGHGVTATDAQNILGGLTAGPIFELALGLSAAVVIIIYIVTGFSFGTLSIAGLLITVAIGAALISASSAEPSVPVLSVPNPGSATAFTIEGAVNTTLHSHPSTSNHTGSGVSQAEGWNITAATLASFVADGFAFSAAVSALAAFYLYDKSLPAPGLATLALTLDLLAWTWDVEIFEHGADFCGTTFLPMVFSFLAAAISYEIYRTPVKSEVPGELLGIDLAGAGAGAVAAMVDYSYYGC